MWLCVNKRVIQKLMQIYLKTVLHVETTLTKCMDGCDVTAEPGSSWKSADMSFSLDEPSSDTMLSLIGSLFLLSQPSMLYPTWFKTNLNPTTTYSFCKTFHVSESACVLSLHCQHSATVRSASQTWLSCLVVVFRTTATFRGGSRTTSSRTTCPMLSGTCTLPPRSTRFPSAEEDAQKTSSEAQASLNHFMDI